MNDGNLRIATVQPLICETFAETMDRQFMLMDQVVEAGAEVVLLPELATTGFTGRVIREDREQVKAHISQSILRLKEWSRMHTVAVSFGSAMFDDGGDERPFNAMLSYLPDGSSFRDEKVHAKEGNEAKHFQAGRRRGGFRYKGVKFDFVICREFRNWEEAETLISKDTDIVFWPGCVRHNRSIPSVDDLTDEKICGFAKKNRVAVLGSNWANFLDSTSEGNMGGSYLANSEGEIVKRCEWDAEDCMIFDWKRP